MTLNLTIAGAQEMHDVNTIATMDPYCLVRIGRDNKEKKTKTAKNGGKNPEWNEQLSFPLTSNDLQSTLVFQLFDDNITRDHPLTHVEIPISTFIAQPYLDQWFPLVNKKEQPTKGRLHVISQYIPGPGMPSAQPQMAQSQQYGQQQYPPQQCAQQYGQQQPGMQQQGGYPQQGMQQQQPYGQQQGGYPQQGMQQQGGYPQQQQPPQQGGFTQEVNSLLGRRF